IYTSTYLLPARKCPNEDSLRKCLYQYIKGPISFRDDFFAYNFDLDKEYNKRVIHFPVAFVHPIDVLDVQNAIKCGTKLNNPIAARSGAHSYEGYGIGDKDFGTGNTLKSLYYEVNKYGFASPGGICPYLGGMGFLYRKFGFSSDNILDAQIVLANGTIVNNAKEYPELLWVIQGAGNAGY
ncbi:13249_t:CDS:2, partial [Racocetra persica]